MKEKNKKKSISYWDNHAESWQEMAYDKKKTYLRFPTSQQRQDITINEIEKLSATKKASIIDIGCADGELIRGLLKKEFLNVKGIDNSRKMIEVAKERLKSEMPQLNPAQFFFVGDADNLGQDETFDFITAVGLIEYLLDIDAFFKKVRFILNPGGYALIESRNKLFNLFSANQYTCQCSVSRLVNDLEDIERFSPFREEKEIEGIIRSTFISIGKTLQDVELTEQNKKAGEFKPFPFLLPQWTPREIEDLSKRHNLKLAYVIYYHPHPFLPKFEKKFPLIFNRLACQMQPLGLTPLGATICSAFIAVIKNEKR